ncbi:MAG: type II secretion system protein [Planctomycetota bacterium]
MKIRMGRVSGFTLVEMMTVIAIMVIIAAMIVGTSAKIQSRSRYAVARTQVAMFENALELYRGDFGKFPPDYHSSGYDEDVTWTDHPPDAPWHPFCDGNSPRGSWGTDTGEPFGVPCCNGGAPCYPAGAWNNTQDVNEARLNTDEGAKALYDYLCMAVPDPPLVGEQQVGPYCDWDADNTTGSGDWVVPVRTGHDKKVADPWGHAFRYTSPDDDDPPLEQPAGGTTKARAWAWEGVGGLIDVPVGAGNVGASRRPYLNPGFVDVYSIGENREDDKGYFNTRKRQVPRQVWAGFAGATVLDYLDLDGDATTWSNTPDVVTDGSYGFATGFGEEDDVSNQRDY